MYLLCFYYYYYYVVVVVVVVVVKVDISIMIYASDIVGNDRRRLALALQCTTR